MPCCVVQVTAMMTAPDPGAAVGAKAISAAAAGSLSQLRGGCPTGWVSSTKADHTLYMPGCVVNIEEPYIVKQFYYRR